MVSECARKEEGARRERTRDMLYTRTGEPCKLCDICSPGKELMDKSNGKKWTERGGKADELHKFNWFMWRN